MESSLPQLQKSLFMDREEQFYTIASTGGLWVPYHFNEMRLIKETEETKT